MKYYFPTIEQNCTVEKLQYWAGHTNIWGPKVRKTEGGKVSCDRKLWVIHKEVSGFLTESCDSIRSFWVHFENETNIVMIGYPRKLPTKDNETCRKRLLQVMVNKLYLRMKCKEVYISPCCFADKPLLERDSPSSTDFISDIKGCNGDINDLTNRIHYSEKYVRLAIIDYAGLSTSPSDVQKFLEIYPNIKELVIDHGKSIEVFTRHQLLEKNYVEKFNCRSGPVKRSRNTFLCPLEIPLVLCNS